MTAAHLAPLEGRGWMVMHDRRVPGTVANIDHLAIGQGDIWVIDSKSWRGRVKVLGDERLWYGKRCLDDVVRVVGWLAARVGEILKASVPVRAALCIHGAKLPRNPLGWLGLVLASPAALLNCLTTTSRTLTPVAVRELSAVAKEALPPAAHSASR